MLFTEVLILVDGVLFREIKMCWFCFLFLFIIFMFRIFNNFLVILIFVECIYSFVFLGNLVGGSRKSFLYVIDIDFFILKWLREKL